MDNVLMVNLGLVYFYAIISNIESFKKICILLNIWLKPNCIIPFYPQAEACGNSYKVYVNYLYHKILSESLPIF